MVSFIFTKCSIYATWVPAGTQETPLFLRPHWFLTFALSSSPKDQTLNSCFHCRVPVLCDVDTNPQDKWADNVRSFLHIAFDVQSSLKDWLHISEGSMRHHETCLLFSLLLRLLQAAHISNSRSAYEHLGSCTDIVNGLCKAVRVGSDHTCSIILWLLSFEMDASMLQSFLISSNVLFQTSS